MEKKEMYVAGGSARGSSGKGLRGKPDDYYS